MSFAQRKKKNNDQQKYFAVPYFMFIVLISLASITRGTQSFTVNTKSVPVLERMISMFHINESAGLMEPYSVLLITCAPTNKSLITTMKNKTVTKKLKDVK